MLDLLLTALHALACCLLAIFGVHRLWLLVDYGRVRARRPSPVASCTSRLPATLHEAASRTEDATPGWGDGSQAVAMPSAPSWPWVTVQVPLYNERDVCVRVVDAVCALRYPVDRLEVQILDDSTDDTAARVTTAVARWRARGIRVEHVRRARRSGYKAGALAEGLMQARGDFLAIFDADFVPPPGFLLAVMPHFHRPDVGMVQARWGHINRRQSWLTRAQAIFLDAHFSVEHTTRSATGRFFNFNGTAGVWRKTAVQHAGGWDAATLTEDLDLSFRAQLAGIRFVYLDDLEVPAELPDDMNAFKGQQHRWAKGSIQTARRLLPQVWRAKLPLSVRLDATTKLLQNAAFLGLALFVCTMPWVAVRAGPSGPSWLAIGELSTLGLATLPAALQFVLAQRARRRPAWRWLWELPLALGIGAALSLHNAKAVWEGFWGLGESSFVRTPKRGGQGRPSYGAGFSSLAWMELALGLAHLGVALSLSIAGDMLRTPFLWLFGGSLVALGAASLGGVRAGGLRAQPAELASPDGSPTRARPPGP